MTDMIAILLKSSENSLADSGKLVSLINTLLRNTAAFINLYFPFSFTTRKKKFQ